MRLGLIGARAVELPGGRRKHVPSHREVLRGALRHCATDNMRRFVSIAHGVTSDGAEPLTDGERDVFCENDRHMEAVVLAFLGLIVPKCVERRVGSDNDGHNGLIQQKRLRGAHRLVRASG
jgi:hypothetical protein